MTVKLEADPLKTDFVRRVAEEGGESINRCFQCGKCSAGCPVSYEMDLPPIRIIRAARLGQKDAVLKSKTIWLCASCETCSTRCPQDVDIAKVMDACRIIARKEKVPAAVPQIPIFSKTMLDVIGMFGRTYELGLIGLLKLKTREFTKDVGLGIKMLKKGKLKLFPSFAGNAASARRILKTVAQKEKS